MSPLSKIKKLEPLDTPKDVVMIPLSDRVRIETLERENEILTERVEKLEHFIYEMMRGFANQAKNLLGDTTREFSIAPSVVAVEPKGKVIPIQSKREKPKKSKEGVLPKIKKEKVKKIKKIESPDGGILGQKGNLNDIGLKRWSTDGYLDPQTNERIYGRDFLRQLLFSEEGFWIGLEKYVTTLDAKTVEAIGGKIPRDKGSYAFRLRKNGFVRTSPKNVCLWLGVLEPERAVFCDENGYLSTEGLLHWCHKGYIDPATQEHMLGKDILLKLSESENFWEGLKKYGEELNLETTIAIGGKFPFSNGSLAKRFNPGTSTITESGLFDGLHIPLSERGNIRGKQKFMSKEALGRWYHEGYLDTQTEEWIYGKDIIQKATESENFVEYIKQYALGLDRETIEIIGGDFPIYPRSFAQRFKGDAATSISIQEIISSFEGMKIEALESEVMGDDLSAEVKVAPISFMDFSGLPKEIRPKISVIISKMLTVDEGDAILGGRNDFCFQATEARIEVFFRNGDILRNLLPYRQYIEETIIDEVWTGEEKELKIHWENTESAT